MSFYPITDRWLASFDAYAARLAAAEYAAQTEAYDRSVCTGRLGRAGILPANDLEMSLISHNARETKQRLLAEHGVSEQAFQWALNL